MELKDIRKLKDTEQSLYAKNTTKTVITANDHTGRYELAPAGTEGSIQPLPKTKLDLSGVQNMIRKGLLVVGTAEEMEGSFQEVENKSEEKTNTDHLDLDVVVEEDKSKKDLVAKECLITGEKVFQTMEEVRNDVPPLHESVKDKAHEFVVQHTPTENGEYETTWSRVQIG